MLESTNMSDMLSQIEYLRQIGTQDQHISADLHTARTARGASRPRWIRDFTVPSETPVRLAISV